MGWNSCMLPFFKVQHSLSQHMTAWLQWFRVIYACIFCVLWNIQRSTWCHKCPAVCSQAFSATLSLGHLHFLSAIWPYHIEIKANPKSTLLCFFWHWPLSSAGLLFTTFTHFGKCLKCELERGFNHFNICFLDFLLKYFGLWGKKKFNLAKITQGFPLWLFLWSHFSKGRKSRFKKRTLKFKHLQRHNRW